MGQQVDLPGGTPGAGPGAGPRPGAARCAAGLLATLLALAPAASLAGPPSDDHSVEYGVKAVFLERFARFVEWPAETVDEPAATFRIVVLGEDPFGGLLEKAYATRTIRGRRVEIRHTARVADITGCNLLFISSSMSRSLDEVLASVRRLPVLTVGDTRGYGEAGVHLNFYLEGDKVRFELNPGALHHASLTASYLLLQVARTVETRGGER